ncbi:similar to Saccharomyces cerevisiae YDR117C TMA64 Protein of unknown function that associates with ribosomes [Maudiozyma saulgeensis]|uniref:SUI1 domain-containing protein n=1 Tax=Maudiozyma saulgeensis TaxID=1789683 RepID=A0A1X7R5Z2_9SACH|nr:similar to Saccharomyces cerevisiae YDR117C TMA64 Protein of unknown function that associates with ribosomes [Kazachstania saulgeensis]
MFKKEPRVKALSNLKNSDRKKLLKTLQTQLKVEDVLIPSDSEVKQTNFTTQHSMGTIYTNDQNVPILVKAKNHDILYPTVFTCWSNPDLLPLIRTHDLVIEHLYNGANLMVAGTLPPFDNRLTPGTVCGIVNYTNPKVVIAVGVIDMDMSRCDTVVGKKGVAVEIIHHLEDCLFPTFKVKLEMPVVDSIQDSDEENAVSKEELDIEDNTASVSETSIDDLATVLDKLSVQDVDHFITRALYYTIVVDDKVQLPMNASNFISNHIMHNLPDVDHNEVNIKKSSWKKTAKFLKHFEKLGFLKLKGKDDSLVVTSLNKDKDELKHFSSYKIGGSKKQTKDETSVGQNGEKLDPKNDLILNTIYKPMNLGKTLMTIDDTPLKRYYSSTEVRDAIQNYIKEKNLVDNKNKKMILLDDLLFNMINIKKSQAAVAPRTVPRSSVLEPILKNNFGEFFQLYKNNGETPIFKEPLKGAMPHVKIVTEMKIGRKIVTRVSNFEIFQITPEALAADLRKICSGSTTIGESLTAKKTAEVQVQGPHGTLIIDHLNKLGVPGKWIDFENKVKSKKKR